MTSPTTSRLRGEILGEIADLRSRLHVLQALLDQQEQVFAAVEEREQSSASGRVAARRLATIKRAEVRVP